MLAGKDTAAQKVANLRARVATRNEYSFASHAVFVPRDRYAMRRILAVETNYFGHGPGPNVFQTNQTNAGNRMAVLQLWPEARGNFALHCFRVDPKVREDAPADDALNDRKSHNF